MKNFLKILVLVMITAVVYIYKEDIAQFLVANISLEKKVSDTLIPNSYYENKNYSFVSTTNDFYAKSRQDLINIFYTVLGAGKEEFTFYCDRDYKDCISDIDAISNDRILLSSINNFVNPYNSFSDVETTRYESSLKIIFKISYIYTDEEIKQINTKVDQILNELVNDSMKDEEKIKVIHDYVIENTKYDSKRSDEKISQYQSQKAYGPLFEGYGICNGYADLMKLFLNKLNIENIKISSENHIWNLVKINDEWLHLDLTWDDPVLENGKEIIDYEYFLITTEELHNKEDNQHFFDEKIYKEAL